MSPEEIRAAILERPDVKALLPDTRAVAEALSIGRLQRQETLITERRVLSVLGVVVGGEFLDALDAFASTVLDSAHPLAAYQSGIRRAIGWLKTEDGIDVGDATSQAMLEALAQAGVVTSVSADAIRALAYAPSPLLEFDVRRAVFADDGSLLV